MVIHVFNDELSMRAWVSALCALGITERGGVCVGVLAYIDRCGRGWRCVDLLAVSSIDTSPYLTKSVSFGTPERSHFGTPTMVCFEGGCRAVAFLVPSCCGKCCAASSLSRAFLSAWPTSCPLRIRSRMIVHHDRQCIAFG